MNPDTVILIEGRGDYLRDLHWQPNGKPELFGAPKEKAMRFTPKDAQEIIAQLGNGFSAEPVTDPWE